MSELNVGDTVAHNFSKVRGKILGVQDNEQGYNYFVEWSGDREDRGGWYKREVLVQLTNRPTPASDETLREKLADVKISSDYGSTHGFEGRLGANLAPEAFDNLLDFVEQTVAAAVQAESRKLLDYAFTRTTLTLSKISDDKVTLPPGLAGQSMQWRQGFKIGMSRLADAIEEELAMLDSEQQKLGGNRDQAN